jgi:hypothetical protein
MCESLWIFVFDTCTKLGLVAIHFGRIFAFDVVGGVVANSLNSCKRFYHTAAKSDEPQYTAFFKNHLELISKPAFRRKMQA